MVVPAMNAHEKPAGSCRWIETMNANALSLDADERFSDGPPGKTYRWPDPCAGVVLKLTDGAAGAARMLLSYGGAPIGVYTRVSPTAAGQRTRLNGWILLHDPFQLVGLSAGEKEKVGALARNFVDKTCRWT